MQQFPQSVAGTFRRFALLFSQKLMKYCQNTGFGQYQFLILHDAVDNITSFHSDTLYAAANTTDSKPILLHIHSYGGRIEPAYLISKTLKRISADKFVAVVPRRAKSAATLIALGADEIHMGMMSELGPIDPVFPLWHWGMRLMSYPDF